MSNASISQLRDAVESQHGGKATFVQAVPVYESFKSQAIWNGAVQVFDLVDSPTGATRAYSNIGTDFKSRFAKKSRACH